MTSRRRDLPTLQPIRTAIYLMDGKRRLKLEGLALASAAGLIQAKMRAS